MLAVPSLSARWCPAAPAGRHATITAVRGESELKDGAASRRRGRPSGRGRGERCVTPPGGLPRTAGAPDPQAAAGAGDGTGAPGGGPRPTPSEILF
ncbi:hypothetical protein Acsp04_16260 [Actinomadura sp. NBRC 104425]|nr:hypothetical protein Acsp04_16260 [Actinomadura sp. NBRC 104425]